jgi:hypothetical protein
MVLYTCNKDIYHLTQNKKVRIEKMSDNEKITLIRVAGKLTQNGVHMATLENVEVKKMMKQIAANAALIILCDVNRTIVSNICDGDFDTIQGYTEELLDKLSTCLAIIGRKGEDLKEVLGVEDIEEAVKYTIYEQTHEDEE